jgi:hypothetical protein
MPTPERVAGVPNGAVDVANQEIRFVFQFADGKQKWHVAKFGVASQLIGALGRLLAELRTQLRAENTMGLTASAEKIAEADIQLEPWAGEVVMQLVTPEGVPYTFSMPPEAASLLAERLRIESAKSTPPGRA